MLAQRKHLLEAVIYQTFLEQCDVLETAGLLEKTYPHVMMLPT